MPPGGGDKKISKTGFGFKGEAKNFDADRVRFSLSFLAQWRSVRVSNPFPNSRQRPNLIFVHIGTDRPMAAY